MYEFYSLITTKKKIHIVMLKKVFFRKLNIYKNLNNKTDIRVLKKNKFCLGLLSKKYHKYELIKYSNIHSSFISLFN